MKKYWSQEELEEFWRLLPEEKIFLGNRVGVQRFMYMLLLKYYQISYSFFSRSEEISDQLLNFGMKQYDIRITNEEFSSFLTKDHSHKKYRQEIREFYGTRLLKDADHTKLESHVYKLALETISVEKLEPKIIDWLKKAKIELPYGVFFANLIKKALLNTQNYLFEYITKSLNPTIHSYIDEILLGTNDSTGETSLTFLKQDSGKSNRDSISVEIQKLHVIHGMNIGSFVMPLDISPNILKFYRRKIASDTPEQIRSRSKEIRYPLVIIFAYLKKQEIIDNLADHVINFIHKIKKQAEKVEFSLNSEIGKLSSGLDSLYQVAEVAHDKPESIIQEAIYPVVSKEQIEAIIKARYLQKSLSARVHKKVMQSYSIYYRKKIFDIMTILGLKSNNKDLLSALALIQKYRNSVAEVYPTSEQNIPIIGLVSKKDLEFVYKDKATAQVSRKDYEYAIFIILKDKLKTKEVWIDGSFKYKDPITDLPKDFDNNKEFYYGILEQPLSASKFTDLLQSKIMTAVEGFDSSLPKNQYVTLTKRRGKDWIKLSPLTMQEKPKNLERLKEDINSKWNVINLLDVLKEVDLREGFTKYLTSSGNREILTPEEIQKRLILCLFAIGTNTGLHRIASASTSNISLDELKYIKRKFINQDDLREAITCVVNAIFRIRNPRIWGDATTACAADSRKFTSWDQNLMTEWHARYQGAGVMIYWHVNTQSICIHSQLKTCSSSEVASMIQGVLNHDSDMLIDSQYVDSHGKSELAFGLTYLLGFDLLPRYANIGPQKIYMPDNNFTCKNISNIATRAINWTLIREHYNSMVQYAVALKIGTATADSIIRQFSRSNFGSQVFKAFIELGKAVKSIFLCRYLSSIELRQEIHSGLNIVENWNSVNDFIFYGKKSIMSSNSRDEQEYSMLCLHLLQVCLAYVNTLLIQDIVNPDSWDKESTLEDKRGLMPLFYGHINPYGTFELDMNKRILLESAL